MLSARHAVLAIKLLSLSLIAALSFFVFTAKLPESKFVKDSLESVEDNSDTVMKFSAATLSTSLAISALPDGFVTPLADSLADMNIYFVAIRLCVLALAVAFVVPCSTHITGVVASDLTAYVNDTIKETEGGASKLQEAMEGGTEDKTMFEKLSDLFQTAIRDISDLMLHFQNTIRKCMNSIAILILTNCLMPLLTFFILMWILQELFQIAIPLSPAGERREHTAESESKSYLETVSAGGKQP